MSQDPKKPYWFAHRISTDLLLDMARGSDLEYHARLPESCHWLVALRNLSIDHLCRLALHCGTDTGLMYLVGTHDLMTIFEIYLASQDLRAELGSANCVEQLNRRGFFPKESLERALSILRGRCQLTLEPLLIADWRLSSPDSPKAAPGLRPGPWQIGDPLSYPRLARTAGQMSSPDPYMGSGSNA